MLLLIGFYGLLFEFYNPGLDADMFARIRGELWKVCAGIPLVRGQMVRVVGIDGLVLTVEPIRKEGDEQ